MKSILVVFTLCLVGFSGHLAGQEMIMEIEKDTMIINKSCCETCMSSQKHWVTAEYRIYTNPAKTTATELGSIGFLLEEQATEIGVKFGQFPKIFYYQQLGTLENSNYSSIYGLGLKEKYQYDLIKNPNIVLAPYLEVGAGFYYLSMVRNVNSSSYISPANNQIDQTKLDNFSITGDLGLNLGYAFTISNIHFGLTANGGYMTNLPSNWKTGQSLAFREKLDLSSLYYGLKLSLSLANCCKM